MAPWNWRFSWLAIFAVNLVVPFVLSSAFTEHGGKGGMYVAIFILWLWPSWLGERTADFANAMRTGGLVVALSQFLPVLQFGAGVVALAVADPSGAPVGHAYLADLLGFVATMITGLILQAVALAVGRILRLCGDRTFDDFLSLSVKEPAPPAAGATQLDPEFH